MRKLFVVLALVFSISSGTAKANTTLMVTLSTDNDPGGFGEMGDLRHALNTINQSLNTTPDDYAIVFASPMTIQLNGILPIINNSPNPVNITIGNPGTTPTVTLDGNSGAYSGFFIPIGNVTIQNIIFQNFAAKGGNGGDGISGGGGGMGAGGTIYAPQIFLNGSRPSITLMNVLINNSAAIGGNGGNYIGGSSTGDEGGGGGGGFSGNGGSILTTGQTGGGGGGGFGGDGGNVTLSVADPNGGGGGSGFPLPGGGEAVPLEQMETQLKALFLHSSLLIPSLPAVTVEMAQAAEVEELSLLGRPMTWTGTLAVVATAVAAEPAPERMTFHTPYKREETRNRGAARRLRMEYRLHREQLPRGFPEA